jgi:hypothetical protein
MTRRRVCVKGEIDELTLFVTGLRIATGPISWTAKRFRGPSGSR